MIDISRGRINLNKCTYQERYKCIYTLVRLDLNGPPHSNPEVVTVPLDYLEPHNGKTLKCPHLHIYVEGFMDKWAIPLPEDKFSDPNDLRSSLEDFFRYCNVIEPPTVQWGLF